MEYLPTGSSTALAITTPPPVSHNYSSPINSSFLTYQNKSALGVAIQYPLNWKRIQADGKAVIFLPPSRKDGFADSVETEDTVPEEEFVKFIDALFQNRQIKRYLMKRC